MLATVKTWDEEFSADRICLCDIGLGVWKDGLLVRLLLAVYQVGGSTTAKVYVDNIVFTYYKEEGGVVGDINGDGTVDVSDVTALINKILGTSDYTDEVCDINGDGEINVSDVTQLINQILQ